MDLLRPCEQWRWNALEELRRFAGDGVDIQFLFIYFTFWSGVSRHLADRVMDYIGVPLGTVWQCVVGVSANSVPCAYVRKVVECSLSKGVIFTQRVSSE